MPSACFLLGCCAAQDRAQPHADRKQAGRLAEDQIEVLVQRDQLAELFHLQQFALDHLLRQFDQRVENAEIALLHRDLEGLHVEPVAGQHALRIAPLRIGRRTAAARLRFIDNVVVNQRRGVDDLDHRAQTNRAAALVVEQLRGKQQQRRADSLAAAGAQVFADLGDRADVRDRVAPELVLKRDEIVPQQIEDFFPVNGGWRAQASTDSFTTEPQSHREMRAKSCHLRDSDVSVVKL